MRVEVADLKVSYRVVELPDLCPKCKIDFTDKYNNLRFWEYQDQSRPGKAAPAADGTTEACVDEDVISHVGEHFIAYTCVVCAGCNEILFEGDVIEE